MIVADWIKSELSKQHGHLFPWTAVCFGLGISGYFSLRFEPDLGAVLAGSFAALGLVIFFHRTGAQYRFSGYFFAFIVLGFTAACISAHLMATPRLAFHYYGPIYGRIVAIDRSGSHAVRLTLDQVVLERIGPDKTPARIRISLHGRQEWLDPMPGQFIGTTGHLSAPNGPVEPGGFDFQRHAWFLRLGAVGYTRVPVLEMKPPEGDLPIGRLRRSVSQHVATYLGGDIGGFAAAVTTGDRSAFSPEAMQALRVSNLAHLLAISGLHMGLLAGFLFAVIRGGLSLWPPWALRLPVKKIAAGAALCGATGYLLMSGASIATQRAYIMAAVALIAVILDRRALTLRAVAVAALLVLLMRPASLLSPGFQMSFAATTALVWVFGLLRDAPDVGMRPWQRSAFGIVLSSAVAGLATAPFAAAHFNQWAAYGLLANVTAVPVMGLIVIPGAVLATVFSPLGGEWIGLEVMGLGLRWILWVAHWISALEGARVPIVTPQAAVLPLISLGACWLILWQGKFRFTGAFFILSALVTWSLAERPDVLISEQGKLIGVMGETGRILSKPKGQGFVAQSWLENDGDTADQSQSAHRILRDGSPVFSTEIQGRPLLHFQGKRGAKEFGGCAQKEIVIADQDIESAGDCLLFTAGTLKKTGAVALWITPVGEVLVQTVLDERGQRLWSPPVKSAQ